MQTSLRLLTASHGDCIFVRHEEDGKTCNVLIDGGPASTFGSLLGQPMPLRKLLDEVRKHDQVIDLGVVTHVDDDHIGGVLRAFSYDAYLPSLAKKFWFNSYSNIAGLFNLSQDTANLAWGIQGPGKETSIQQGISLESRLSSSTAWRAEPLHNECPVLQEGPFSITILSPSIKSLGKLARNWEREISKQQMKTSSQENDYATPMSSLVENDIFIEDKSVPNGSSLALLLEVSTKKILLLADALPSVILEKLSSLGYSENAPLEVDLVKVSHHGSSGNTSADLLKHIKTNCFLISTNGAIFSHPDKVTIARIIASNPQSKIYFNYQSVLNRILLPDERIKYDKQIMLAPKEIIL